jgi:hypothetical protein
MSSLTSRAMILKTTRTKTALPTGFAKAGFGKA